MFQIVDTPGLLNRREPERNRIEHFTIATIQHTRSAIAFVTDLSAHCGTSVDDQLAIRRSVLSLASSERQDPLGWIDIVSKADLGHTAIGLEQLGPTEPVLTSVAQRRGLESLSRKIRHVMKELS